MKKVKNESRKDLNKMAVRNQHSRQASKFIFKEIDGTLYAFEPATYVEKSKARNLMNRAIRGTVKLNPALRSVIVNEDGTFIQQEI